MRKFRQPVFDIFTQQCLQIIRTCPMHIASNSQNKQTNKQHSCAQHQNSNNVGFDRQRLHTESSPGEVVFKPHKSNMARCQVFVIHILIKFFSRNVELFSNLTSLTWLDVRLTSTLSLHFLSFTFSMIKISSHNHPEKNQFYFFVEILFSFC